MSEHNAGNAQEKPALVPVSPAPLVELVLDGLASPHSRRAYRRALGEFFTWYPSNAAGEGFTRATVQRYRSHLAERSLSAASINLALAAIRKLATEAASNELLSPVAAAAIRSVGGARRTGIRTGNWLTLPQAQQLLAAPDPAMAKGLRDRVLLGLLVGSGLRRGELAGLDFDAMSRSARAAGRSWISSASTAASAPSRCRPGPRRRWMAGPAAAGIDSGPVLRRVSKAGRVGPGPLGAQSIFETVAGYGDRIGVRITPHDLRRTFAKLAHLGRAPLEQIQIYAGACLDPDHRALPGTQPEPPRRPLRSVGARGLGDVRGAEGGRGSLRREPPQGY